jgi:signal transduction histidine kinase
MRAMIGIDDGEARNLNERMLRLVTNIKDFLRLGGRRQAPKREKFNLFDVYAQAYSLFRADYQDLYDGEDIKVDVQGNVQDGEFVPMVCADETLTMQIIWNLLGNDLKYAAPYGPVSVKIRRDADFIRIGFIDEGPGMSPYQMRHAFDRYYRARTVLESGKGGFGIGLCTAREFAAAMGGKLEVCQNQPKGCIFSLALPCAI